MIQEQHPIKKSMVSLSGILSPGLLLFPLNQCLLDPIKADLVEPRCNASVSREHFEYGQIHAPVTSWGSVGTDQEILERHQLVQL